MIIHLSIYTRCDRNTDVDNYYVPDSALHETYNLSRLFPRAYSKLPYITAQLTDNDTAIQFHGYVDRVLRVGDSFGTEQYAENYAYYRAEVSILPDEEHRWGSLRVTRNNETLTFSRQEIYSDCCSEGNHKLGRYLKRIDGSDYEWFADYEARLVNNSTNSLRMYGESLYFDVYLGKNTEHNGISFTLLPDPNKIVRNTVPEGTHELRQEVITLRQPYPSPALFRVQSTAANNIPASKVKALLQQGDPNALAAKHIADGYSNPNNWWVFKSQDNLSEYDCIYRAKKYYRIAIADCDQLSPIDRADAFMQYASMHYNPGSGDINIETACLYYSRAAQAYIELCDEIEDEKLEDHYSALAAECLYRQGICYHILKHDDDAESVWYFMAENFGDKRGLLSIYWRNSANDDEEIANKAWAAYTDLLDDNDFWLAKEYLVHEFAPDRDKFDEWYESESDEHNMVMYHLAMLQQYYDAQPARPDRDDAFAPVMLYLYLSSRYDFFYNDNVLSTKGIPYNIMKHAAERGSVYSAYYLAIILAIDAKELKDKGDNTESESRWKEAQRYFLMAVGAGLRPALFNLHKYIKEFGADEELTTYINNCFVALGYTD